jgi:hypothetical protein
MRIKKLRSACDNCHQSKVKCSGGRPCEKCHKLGFDCFYSASNRIGRPKNSRNKSTIERARHFQQAREARLFDCQFDTTSNGADFFRGSDRSRLPGHPEVEAFDMRSTAPSHRDVLSGDNGVYSPSEDSANDAMDELEMTGREEDPMSAFGTLRNQSSGGTEDLFDIDVSSDHRRISVRELTGMWVTR